MDLSSPRPDDASFNHYWDKFLPDIRDRENLKASHLDQLRLLCDLYVEYDYYTNVIDCEGRTYESEGGRNGLQIKMRPEVTERKSVIGDIRVLSRHLDLSPYKDKKLTGEKKRNEFEDDDDDD